MTRNLRFGAKAQHLSAHRLNIQFRSWIDFRRPGAGRDDYGRSRNKTLRCLNTLNAIESDAHFRNCRMIEKRDAEFTITRYQRLNQSTVLNLPVVGKTQRAANLFRQTRLESARLVATQKSHAQCFVRLPIETRAKLMFLFFRESDEHRAGCVEFNV